MARFNIVWLSVVAVVAVAAGSIVGGAALRASPSPAAGILAPLRGASIFQSRCQGCHDPAVGRAPSRADLSRLPQSDIVQALSGGVMTAMAKDLTQDDIHAVAAYLSPVQGAGAQVGPDPMCATPAPPITPAEGDWSSVGVDDAMTRFQRLPGLTLADLPRLKVKWSFSMSGGGQPTVVGDWLFMTNRSGKFYALDARQGCVRWVVNGLPSRTTPVVVRSKIAPSGWATFIGEATPVVRAFDAQTGKPLWRSPLLETHPISQLTATPRVAGNLLLVPISSLEEAAAGSPQYNCCTFRGSLVALDLATGKVVWKTYTIAETPHLIRKRDNGAESYGPAGAALWATPAVDMRRGVAYETTGDSYTDVDAPMSDAAFAIDIKTGRILWHTQVTGKDNWVTGCGPTITNANCPTPLGPDFDFGAGPVLMTLANGHQVLLAGQKSGIAYGFDPATGRLLWKRRLGSGSAYGGMEWGLGVDDHRAYVPISDLGLWLTLEKPEAAPSSPLATDPVWGKPHPGVYALDPLTGALLWQHPALEAQCHYASDGAQTSRCANAQQAAPAVIPGAVFEGGVDGWFRAYDTQTGKILWEYSTTAQTYSTLNGVPNQPGGAMDGMGPTIAHGMVYAMSGHGNAEPLGKNGVNVLLAFSVDGK